MFHVRGCTTCILSYSIFHFALFKILTFDIKIARLFFLFYRALQNQQKYTFTEKTLFASKHSTSHLHWNK